MIRRASVGIIADPVPGLLITLGERGTLAPQGGPARRRVVVTIEEEFPDWQTAAEFVAEIEKRDTMQDFIARCEGSGLIAAKRTDTAKVRAGYCTDCDKTVRVDEHGRFVSHSIDAEVRKATKGMRRKKPVNPAPEGGLLETD